MKVYDKKGKVVSNIIDPDKSVSNLYALDGGEKYTVEISSSAAADSTYTLTVEQDNWVFAPHGAYVDATPEGSRNKNYAVYMNAKTIKTIIQNYYLFEFKDTYEVKDFSGKSEEQIKNSCNDYAEILMASLSNSNDELSEVIGYVSGGAGIVIDLAENLSAIGFVFTAIDGVILANDIKAMIDKHVIAKALKNGNLNIIALITESKEKTYPEFKDVIRHSVSWAAWEEEIYINKYVSPKNDLFGIGSFFRLNSITPLNYYIPQQQSDGSWRVVPYDGFH